MYAGAGIIIAVFVTYNIPNEFWANRFLHAFGGGFLLYMICYSVMKDHQLTIDHFRFFVFSFLVVTSLGVANEMMELFLQTTTHLVFADSVTDTWLDLLSNIVGITLGAVLLSFKRF